MKKIKSQSHLEQEKMKLRVQELELEKSLHKDWMEVREKFSPGNILKNHSANDHNAHWLVNGLHVVARSLTKKMVQKAEEKIEDKTEKSVAYLWRRMNNVLSGKNKK